MSVRDTKERVSSHEFASWIAFDQIKAMFQEQAEMEARMKSNLRD